MYITENFAEGTVRAWHAHKRERKWVLAVSRAALACCVEVDDWESPSVDAEVHRFVLDAANPSVLAVPAGYANGAMSLLPDTKLLYLSNAAARVSRSTTTCGSRPVTGIRGTSPNVERRDLDSHPDTRHAATIGRRSSG